MPLPLASRSVSTPQGTRKVAIQESLGTALHDAIASGHHIEVLRLLQAGADPEEKDVYGLTALLRAARSGNIRIIEALLHFQAKVDSVTSEGRTALHKAAACRDKRAVQLLLGARAEVNARSNDQDPCPDWRQETPAHVAARRGFDASLQLMIEAKADLGLRTAGGQSVQELASSSSAWLQGCRVGADTGDAACLALLSRALPADCTANVKGARRGAEDLFKLALQAAAEQATKEGWFSSQGHKGSTGSPAGAGPAAGAAPPVLAAESWVRIVGLTHRSDLNGQVGTAVGYVPERDRWQVRLLAKAAAPAALGVRAIDLEVLTKDDWQREAAAPKAKVMPEPSTVEAQEPVATTEAKQASAQVDLRETAPVSYEVCSSPVVAAGAAVQSSSSMPKAADAAVQQVRMRSNVRIIGHAELAGQVGTVLRRDKRTGGWLVQLPSHLVRLCAEQLEVVGSAALPSAAGAERTSATAPRSAGGEGHQETCGHSGEALARCCDAAAQATADMEAASKAMAALKDRDARLASAARACVHRLAGRDYKDSLADAIQIMYRSEQCVVCLEAKAVHVALSCNHLVCCGPCRRQLVYEELAQLRQITPSHRDLGLAADDVLGRLVVSCPMCRTPTILVPASSEKSSSAKKAVRRR